jgi:pimeloyl-ACP methyl ester carboxylesterase
MNAVSVAGTSVSCTTAGSGRGLMLLHGTSSDSRSAFGHIVGDLATDRLVIPPDYAGCGRSTIPDGDIRGLLPKISAPTLVVALTHDSLVPLYHSRHLHENIAGSSYTEIARGHAVPMEKPDEFVRGVREFVLDGEGPAAA